MSTDNIKFSLLVATIVFVHETIGIIKLCHVNGILWLNKLNKASNIMCLGMFMRFLRDPLWSIMQKVTM